MFTASAGTGSFGIYTMKPDGSDVTRVVSSPATHPEWSPDGSKILYLSGSAIDGFTIVNADGTNPRPLGRGSIFTPWTAWSPDGSKISFTGSPFGTLWTMSPDGSGAAPLSDSSFYDRMPDWQPVPAPRRSDFAEWPGLLQSRARLHRCGRVRPAVWRRGSRLRQMRQRESLSSARNRTISVSQAARWAR